MSDHCLLSYKDGGACRSLAGKIFWTFVYVEDPESKWTNEEKKKQQETNLEVIRYLKDMAAQESVNVQMFAKSYSVALSSAIRTDDIASCIRAFTDSVGVSSLSEMNRQLQRQQPGCQNVYVFLVNKYGRGFAQPTTGRENFGAEYCVVYKGEFSVLLHEALHVFGAADLYYPEQIKQAARDILGESVMLGGSCVIDDLTKYLIGWHRTPDRKAQRLLDATASVTEEAVAEALKREEVGKNGYGRTTYSDGSVYEGNFVNGVASGYGKLQYADGTVYVGEFQMNNPNGKGKLTYVNGTVCEGEFKDGSLHGKGKITYYNGTVYEGDIKNGTPDGYGKYIYSNGARYEGEVRNNKHEGEGCLTYQNGVVQKGYFENNEYKGKRFFRKR